MTHDASHEAHLASLHVDFMISPPATIQDQILNLVGRGVSSTSDIIEAIDSTAATIKGELTALVKAGRLVRPRHGYYDLPAAAPIHDLPQSPPSDSGDATLADEIVAMVRQAGDDVSTGEICGEMRSRGYAESSVKAQLSALVQAGILNKPRHGHYAIAPRTRVRDSGTSPYDTGVVRVPLASVKASAGAGSDPFTEEVAGYYTIDRIQLRRETGADPSRVFFMLAVGVSMYPDIAPGDVLRLIRHEGEPIIDGVTYIWRGRYDGILVKRARWDTNTGVLQLQGTADPEPVGRIVPQDDDPAWVPIARVDRIIKHS